MSPDDHRSPLLGLLADYRQRYPGETDMVDRYRRFVESHHDCFERSQLSGHVTGSALILDSSGKRLLLTHHRKLDRWLQPGGHADGEHNVLRVALAEAEEESGLQRIEPLSTALLDVDIHPIPERGDEPRHFHYDCRFLLRSAGSDDYVVSDESHDLAWVSIDRIEDYTSETSILRMIGKVELVR